MRAFEHAPDGDLGAENRGETWLMQWECGVRFVNVRMVQYIDCFD